MSRENFQAVEGLSVNEFADAILTYGTYLTLNGIGEPGIGKTHVCGRLKEVLGTDDYHYHIFDMGRMDVGDLALPSVTEINGVTVSKFVPNADFGSQFKGKKVCIMFDEIYKAPKPVLNAVASLLQDRRLNDWIAPEGSIFFCATNHSTDGCGDKPQAFIKRRTVKVNVKKPSAGIDPTTGDITKDGWVSWAIDNDIDPLVILFVKEFPQCLDSYMDGSDNKMIFNPAREPSDDAFVCPYTLKLSSDITKKRGKVSDHMTRMMLKGAIGEYASREMMALSKYADKMIPIKSVVDDPDNAPVPSDVMVRFMMTTKALSVLDENVIGSFIKYFKRFPDEYEGMWVRSVLNSKSKQDIGTDCPEFVKRATEMQWLF